MLFQVSTTVRSKLLLMITVYHALEAHARKKSLAILIGGKR